MVKEDREFLFWRERLGVLRTEWERAQENEEALLRGPLLSEAQKWFDQRSEDLSEPERKFISSSRELRDRLSRLEWERRERDLEAAQRLARAESERAKEAANHAKEQSRAASKLRRLAWVLAIAAFAAIAAGGAAVFELNYARRAESTTRAAEQENRESASQAHASLAQYSHEAGNDPQALAHLAQALRLNPMNHQAAAFTETLLTRTSWALPVSNPMGPDLGIHSAQFSPDGRRVLTASWDDPAPRSLNQLSDGKRFTARLWDAQTGEQIGEPLKHSSVIFSAQFSPDGRRVSWRSFGMLQAASRSANQ